jgi:hypothetical protein
VYRAPSFQGLRGCPCSLLVWIAPPRVTVCLPARLIHSLHGRPVCLHSLPALMALFSFRYVCCRALALPGLFLRGAAVNHSPTLVRRAGARVSLQHNISIVVLQTIRWFYYFHFPATCGIRPDHRAPQVGYLLSRHSAHCSRKLVSTQINMIYAVQLPSFKGFSCDLTCLLKRHACTRYFPDGRP